MCMEPKHILTLFVAGVLVRVELHREFSVCVLDFLFRRVLLDTQDLIEVHVELRGGHGAGGHLLEAVTD